MTYIHVPLVLFIAFPEIKLFQQHVKSDLFSDKFVKNFPMLTLARTGGATPLRFFADSEKRRRVAPPGFGLPYGANLAQFLAKKKLTGSGQVTEL